MYIYTEDDDRWMEAERAAREWGQEVNDKIQKARIEVAREIFEEIEKVSCRVSESNQNGFTRVVCYQLSAEKFAELKKKYTEGKK